jgi:TIR domain
VCFRDLFPHRYAMSRIFLSHSSKDNFVALALFDWLKSEGWDDVFFDIDVEQGIAASERWERKLHEAAGRCEAVVFLVSANWLKSGWCLKEYNLALGLNKRLFAILIEPTTSTADLPPELTTWQIIDLVRRQDMQIFRVSDPNSHEEQHVAFSREGLRQLKVGLEKAGLDPKYFAWPPANDRERSPYRGLQPLEAGDAGIFFGRDTPIIAFTDALRGLRASAAPRLLVILGASGAGKSSFLRAGLLPRLKRDDSNFVPLPPIRPERAVLTGENGFLAALEATFPDRARADLRKAINDGAAGLRPLFAELANTAFSQTLAQADSKKPPTIVIPVDQAEELFRTEGAQESSTFIELIRDLAAADEPAVIVMFTIRSDSYDALQNAKPLEGMPQQPLSLPPMPHNAYREVIEGPARRVVQSGGKLAIEPRLVDLLLEDIEKGGGKDALPLLAFTLQQLYREYGRAGALRLSDYNAFGGLKGTIDAAVERAFMRAESDPRVPRDRAAREALLRRGLIPWLAGVDPDTKSPRRNIARRSDIPAEAGPLIDLLVEERLLSTDVVVQRDLEGNEVQVGTIEPTHEALLRQWGLLKGWLAEDFALLATLEGVNRAARDWSANGMADAWLAHQGQRLTDALNLDMRPDIAARIDATDRAYLAQCRAVEDKRKADQERRSREREEEQARRLADAQKIAAANKRIALTAGVGLAFAIVLATAAGMAWRHAKNNADSAVQALSTLIQTTSEVVRPIARLDAVEALVQQARTAMDRFSSFAEDSRISQQRARTLLLLAQIDWERGNLKNVREESQQAYALLDKLAANGDVEFRFLRAQSRHMLGLVSFDENNKDGALSNYQAAVSELTDLLTLKPDDATATRWQKELADVNQDLGDVLLTKFNDPDKALAAFKNCYDERVSVAEVNNDAAAKHDVAWALNKQGDVAVRQNREDDALVLFTEARDQIAQLGDDLWNNILWPDHLAVIDNNVGLIYRDKAAYGQAVDNFAVAETILDRVIRRDPNNLFRRNSLSWTYYIRAEAQFRWALADHNTGLLKQSRDNLVTAVEHYSEVISQAPDKVQWQIGRVGAQANLDAVDGFLAQWAGSDGDAAEDFAKAANLFVSNFIPLVDQIPRPDFVADTAEFLDWAGMAAEKIGKTVEARNDLNDSRATLVAYRSIMGEQNYARLEPRIDGDLSGISK